MATGTLLKRSEQTTCERIAASTTGLNGKRATALLALNTGATQTNAASRAELTLGQVRYLLTIFRDKGMTIFAAPATPKPTAKSPTVKTKAPTAAKEKKAGKGDKKKSKKDKDKKSKKKEKSSKKKDKKSKKKKK